METIDHLERKSVSSDAEYIIENSELILRDFADSPLYDESQNIQPWATTLYPNIIRRLDGVPAKRYLSSLTNASRAVDEKKERILAAALCYELKHRHSMDQRAYYNHLILYRLAISISQKNTDSILGQSAQMMLDKISLEEIYKEFRDSKGGKTNPSDIPNLSVIALERLDKRKEDGPIAKEILNHARDAILDAYHGTYSETERINNITYVVKDFSTNVIEYIFLELAQRFPYIMKKILKTLNKLLSNEDIPVDYSERRRRELEIENWHDKREFLNMCNLKNSAQALLDQSKVLQGEYDALKEKIKREEEEIKQQEILDKLKQNEEKKLQENLATEENRQSRIREAENERIRNNNSIDLLVDQLSHFEIDETALEAKCFAKLNNSSIHDLPKLMDEEWNVVELNYYGTNAIFDIENSVRYLTSELNGDKEKKNLLLNKWNKTKLQAQEIIDFILISLLEKILSSIRQNQLSFIPEEHTVYDFKTYVYNISSLINFIEERIKTDHNNIVVKVYLQNLLELATEKREAIMDKEDEILRMYEKKEKQMKDLEKQKELEELKREYLLDQISNQTKYLSRLYAASTDMYFGDIECFMESYEGESIGSATMEHSLYSASEQTNSLKICYKLARSSIFIESYEDLESIKKRLALINWVVPREAANIIDQENDDILQIFTEKIKGKISEVSDRWKGNNPEIAKDLIPNLMEEVAIDGLGFRLIIEHGSSNIDNQTHQEKTLSAAKAYLALMSVFENDYKRQAADPEIKPFLSLIILKQIAIGEVMLSKIVIGEIILNEKNYIDVDNKLVNELEKYIARFKELFQETNQETGFVNKAQIKRISKLFKKVFHMAQNILSDPN